MRGDEGFNPVEAAHVLAHGNAVEEDTAARDGRRSHAGDEVDVARVISR